MKHLNNDILCSIGVRTTGPLPYHNDLNQIAVLPLTYSITPRQDILPFDLSIKPGRPENIDYETMDMKKKMFLETQQYAMDPYTAAELFEHWFDKLHMRFNKRIQVVGYNTPKCLAFIQDWLGPKNFERFFDYRHRDVVTIATFLNDHADYTGQPYVVQKVDLSYLCHTFRIETSNKTRDAMEDAMLCAELYKNMMQKNVTTFEQHQRKKMATLLNKLKGTLSTALELEIDEVLKNEKILDQEDNNEDNS